MDILVNGITLNANNAYSERDTTTGDITYYIVLPQSEMDYADLKVLFKNNTEDITKTDDSGNTELFASAEYKHILDDDTNGLYTVVLTTNENAHQLARNRQLEADKANLEGIVASKDNEISTLNSAISEKDTTITEQAETISTLEVTIATKDAEIEELLVIAEEYADLLFVDSTVVEEIETPESEV